MALSFLREFEGTMAILRDHSKLGAVWRHGTRRYPMRRFPFLVVYSESAGGIRVLAVAHQHRHPDYWKGRS